MFLKVPIQVLSGALDVDSDFISSWCEYLESQPRSVQVFVLEKSLADVLLVIER